MALNAHTSRMFMALFFSVDSCSTESFRLSYRLLPIPLALALMAQIATADVLNRSAWVVSASVGASPGNAIDGDITTRWTTGVSQTNGMWFQVDTGGGTPPTFTNIVLDAGTSTGDYPRGYQVNVSSDAANWGSPVAAGAGSA